MALADTAPAITAERQSRSFFSPTLDFLCLGGGSLVMIPILAFAIPDDLNGETLLLTALLANVINHPHFAHSYQIFYRTYPQVMRQPDMSPSLRLRYLWAGVISPVIILGALAAALFVGDQQTLGLAVNAMGFFVGWHYVKQGYGMIMVDAARLRCFFGERQKKILLVNSYLCWGLAWALANRTVAERDLWGISYAAIDVPLPVLWGFILAVSVSSLLVLVTLLQHVKAHGGATPINGIMAYVAALYPWLLLGSEPIVGALIPAFHSLQYLIIVWRVQLNVERAKPGASEHVDWMHRFGIGFRRDTARFVGFLGNGFVIGLLGFWLIPLLAGFYVAYDRAEYGPNLFLFLFWIFINIHHYFIDNAMWRKENPHTLKYLFAKR
jgi:hypothetical protein